MQYGCRRLLRWFSLTLVLVLAPGVCVPAAAAGTPITLAVSRSPLSLLVFVAADRGFFAREGVDVLVKDCVGGHRCLKLMFAGQADVATAAELPVVLHAFERNDFAIVTTIATSTDDVKVVSRKSVSRPEQLVGRRVGMVAGTTSQYFLDIFLLSTGVNPEQLSSVPLQPETALEALRSGQVDAVSLVEPFALQARALIDGNILSERGTYAETFNLVARQTVIGARAEQLRAVLRALSRAQALVEEKPAEAKAVMQRHLQIEPAVIEQMWPGFSFRLSLEQSLLTTMEGEARWAIRAGHVTGTRIPNFLGFVHTGVLRSVRNDAVRLPE
ncbi:ABC transporter substrate-binding protein [Niveibacterium sp. SC-1]|uniref:ABC transporter substrate-binding protein n=1 Tax=Niveibacterium sp. SC-1 TaxID=3135646 RepID=UPI00311F37CE